MKVLRIQSVRLPTAKSEPGRERKRRRRREKGREQPTFMAELDQARRKLADA